MVSAPAPVASPGQSASAPKPPRSAQAKTRRRTSRPWLSSNASKQRRAEREGVRGEPGLDLGVLLPAVAFQGQQVVAAAGHDPPGDRRLTGERVQADQATLEVEAVE